MDIVSYCLIFRKRILMSAGVFLWMFIPAPAFMISTFAFENETIKDSCSQKYIETYFKIAIRQQKKYKIPASIILAQGLLESGAGQSFLALAGNNHFGIKCTDWKGLSVYKKDDDQNDCFRKYLYVDESFEDHSRFLSERSHYRSLFSLKLTDYRGWANGLKKCGYATDSQYAAKLIKLIEEYQLYCYDTAKETDSFWAVEKRKQLNKMTIKSSNRKSNSVKKTISKK